MNNQNYEKARQECWDALRKELLKDEVQWQPVSRKEIVNFVFDRAYALCKQTETITQEDVNKAARKAMRKEYFCESCAWKDDCDLCGGQNTAFDCCECPAESYEDGFKDGANFVLGKQENDADTVTIDKEEYDKLCKYRRYVANWVPYFNVCPICGEYNQSGCICANCNNDKNWNNEE